MRTQPRRTFRIILFPPPVEFIGIKSERGEKDVSRRNRIGNVEPSLRTRGNDFSFIKLFVFPVHESIRLKPEETNHGANASREGESRGRRRRRAEETKTDICGRESRGGKKAGKQGRKGRRRIWGRKEEQK